MAKKLPPLSSQQIELMQIVWESGEVSVADVLENLGEGKSLSRTAVRTQLERMEAKGWLKHRADGKAYLYSAAVAQGNAAARHVQQLIDRMFGGKPERLMVAMLDSRDLSLEELQELQRLVEASKEKLQRSFRSGGKTRRRKGG